VPSTISSRWLLSFLVVGLGLFGPGLSARAGGRVKVAVVTILASKDSPEVDPRLKHIAEEVRKTKPKLKGFQLANMTCKSLTQGEQWKVKLVDGQEAVVVVEQPANKQKNVILRVRAPRQGEIVYKTVCGKFLPIVTRYKTKKGGDRLIIAIMVKPCHKK
jgi:hypothetical protein